MNDSAAKTLDRSANGLDALRIIVTLVFAVGQVVGGFIGFVLEWDNTIVSRSFENQVILTPAGYAFVIWNFLFLGGIAFGLYQAWPANWTNPILRRAGWYATAAFAANTAWELYVPWFGLDLGSLVLIALIPAPIIVLMTVLADLPLSTSTRAVLVPIYALGGWGTAAAVVNILLTINWEGWNTIELSQATLAVGCLVVGLVTAALVFWRTQAIDYLAAVLWGLIAIAVANIPPRGEIIVLASASAAVVLLVTLVVVLWARRQTQPLSKSEPRV